MSTKASILVVIGALCAGFLAVGGPPLTITIVIPFWLRTIGAFSALAGAVLWFGRDFNDWIEPYLARLAAWLSDEV
jgi:hypothetical protein